MNATHQLLLPPVSVSASVLVATALLLIAPGALVGEEGLLQERPYPWVPERVALEEQAVCLDCAAEDEPYPWVPSEGDMMLDAPSVEDEPPYPSLPSDAHIAREAERSMRASESSVEAALSPECVDEPYAWTPTPDCVDEREAVLEEKALAAAGEAAFEAEWPYPWTPAGPKE